MLPHIRIQVILGFAALFVLILWIISQLSAARMALKSANAKLLDLENQKLSLAQQLASNNRS